MNRVNIQVRFQTQLYSTVFFKIYFVSCIVMKTMFKAN